jgi:hypothetical protein
VDPRVMVMAHGRRGAGTLAAAQLRRADARFIRARMCAHQALYREAIEFVARPDM